MEPLYQVYPIGAVRKCADSVHIEIFEAFAGGLLGIDAFSHILVLYWFHENDSPQSRSTLQVHPRKDPQNPLTGVFATHSPVRPNLIALTRCRLLGIHGRILEIDEIDARDGSPVLDIKGYFPDKEPLTGVRVPDWANHAR